MSTRYEYFANTMCRLVDELLAHLKQKAARKANGVLTPEEEELKAYQADQEQVPQRRDHAVLPP